MEITKHELKTWTQYYWPVVTGEKSFEIRKNDRGYTVGDYLELQEYDPKTEQYSGNSATFIVTYLTDFEQKPNHVVMGLKPVVQQKPLSAALDQVSRDLGDRVQVSGDGE